MGGWFSWVARSGGDARILRGLHLIGQNFWSTNWRGGRLCGAKEKGREKLESIKPTSWIDLGKSLKPLSFSIKLELDTYVVIFHEE